MVKLDYRSYDTLIGLIHGVPQSDGNMGSFLAQFRNALRTATASLALYQADRSMTAFAMSAENYRLSVAGFAKAGRDSHLAQLGQRSFRRAVRMSELAPYEDLVKQEWYRNSFLKKGLRHSLCQDMAIGPLNLRLIACREQSLSDFDSDDVEFFERVHGHFQAAARHFRPEAFLDAWRSESLDVFDLRPSEQRTIGGPAEAGRCSILREAYGLSPAEVRVAITLAQGFSCVDAAAMLNRSVDTVRSHLKKIHRKLRVARRGDLMRALLAIPLNLM